MLYDERGFEMPSGNRVHFVLGRLCMFLVTDFVGVLQAKFIFEAGELTGFR